MPGPSPNREPANGREDTPGLIPGAEPFSFGSGASALLFVHGWTSSPRELRFLAERLSSRYHCRGILLEGHGTLAEDLAGTNWHKHLGQVKAALEELAGRYEHVSLIGLSYGAVLSLHAAASFPIRNIVLLAPFLKTSKKVFLNIHSSDLAPFLPSFIKSLSKNPDQPIFHSEELARHIRYSTMPLLPMKSVIECARRVMPLLSRITCPVLLIHSVADRTADYFSAVRLFELLGSENKTLQPLTRSGHIITLDYERLMVEKLVQEWLEKFITS